MNDVKPRTAKRVMARPNSETRSVAKGEQLPWALKMQDRETAIAAMGLKIICPVLGRGLPCLSKATMRPVEAHISFPTDVSLGGQVIQKERPREAPTARPEPASRQLAAKVSSLGCVLITA